MTEVLENNYQLTSTNLGEHEGILGNDNELSIIYENPRNLKARDTVYNRTEETGKSEVVSTGKKKMYEGRGILFRKKKSKRNSLFVKSGKEKVKKPDEKNETNEVANWSLTSIYKNFEDNFKDYESTSVILYDNRVSEETKQLQDDSDSGLPMPETTDPDDPANDDEQDIYEMVILFVGPRGKKKNIKRLPFTIQNLKEKGSTDVINDCIQWESVKSKTGLKSWTTLGTAVLRTIGGDNSEENPEIALASTAARQRKSSTALVNKDDVSLGSKEESKENMVDEIEEKVVDEIKESETEAESHKFNNNVATPYDNQVEQASSSSGKSQDLPPENGKFESSWESLHEEKPIQEVFKSSDFYKGTPPSTSLSSSEKIENLPKDSDGGLLHVEELPHKWEPIKPFHFIGKSYIPVKKMKETGEKETEILKSQEEVSSRTEEITNECLQVGQFKTKVDFAEHKLFPRGCCFFAGNMRNKKINPRDQLRFLSYPAHNDESVQVFKTQTNTFFTNNEPSYNRVNLQSLTACKVHDGLNSSHSTVSQGCQISNTITDQSSSVNSRDSTGYQSSSEFGAILSRRFKRDYIPVRRDRPLVRKQDYIPEPVQEVQQERKKRPSGISSSRKEDIVVNILLSKANVIFPSQPSTPDKEKLSKFVKPKKQLSKISFSLSEGSDDEIDEEPNITFKDSRQEGKSFSGAYKWNMKNPVQRSGSLIKRLQELSRNQGNAHPHLKRRLFPRIYSDFSIENKSNPVTSSYLLPKRNQKK